MRRMANVLALALVSVFLGSLPPAAATTVDQVCTTVYTPHLNLAAAARVMVPDGRKAPRPAGAASAKGLATLVLADTHGHPCDEPLSESGQANIDNVQELIDQGDATGAHDYLMELVNELRWSAQRMRQGLRAGSTCEEFDSHALTLPAEVRTAIGIAQSAQSLGYDDVATAALGKAVSITTAWGDSGADGQATSIPDWMGITSKLELIGADQSAIDRASASMTRAAKDAYDRYDKSACRATTADITCFLKAAQFLAMTGSEPATFAKDVAYQLRTARTAPRGNERRCPVEKYLLRITYDSTRGDGQSGHFDTGLMTLTVRNGRITSPDRGPLVISSGRGSCWAKDVNDVWQRLGEGALTGGSFPYRVSGSDGGAALHLRLAQQAKVTISMGGGTMCEAFAELGVYFMNQFLAQLSTPGIELPAGAKDVDVTETTYGVFEPTGETTSDTSHIVFKMIYPKRR